MGTFALCWESAARDIRSLLTLHRVHPQVRTDIQRILSSLLRKTYEHMTVSLSEDLTDSPEQVCRAIVDDIVKDTFSSALPESDMRAWKLRCMTLEEEKANLKASAAEDARRIAELQGLLGDLKKAHDYMLHSYFREVLMLRYRADDLHRQLRNRRAHATGLTSHPGGTSSSPQTVASQLHQFGSKTAYSRGRCCSASQRSTSALSPPAPCDTPDMNTGVGYKGAQVQHSAHPDLQENQFEADAHVRTPAAAASVATEGAAATSLDDTSVCVSHRMQGGKNHDVFGSSLGRTGSRPPKVASPHTIGVPTFAAMDGTENVAADSVDAIFDYEEYIRIFNGESERHAALQSRLSRALSISEPRITENRHRLHNARTQMHPEAYVPVGSTSGSLLANLEAASAASLTDQGSVNSNGFRLLLGIVLEPIQHGFHIQLEELREAVTAMQQKHADDMRQIRYALNVVQNCNDALLDFLYTFVHQTRSIVSAIAKDAQAQNIMELLSTAAPSVQASEAMRPFFTSAESATTAVDQQGPSPPADSSPPTPPHFPSAEESSRGPAARNLSSRKKWRLKPNVALRVQRNRSSAFSMHAKQGGACSVEMASRMPHAPKNTAEEVNYYRADLSLPYWRSHPVTSQVQVVFDELLEAVAKVRAVRASHLLEADGSGNAKEFRLEREVHDAMALSRYNSDQRNSRSQCVASEADEADISHYFSSSLEGDDLSEIWGGHRSLPEGWRTSVVSGTDGLSAADLLHELSSARMRRACDRVRLKTVEASLLQVDRDGTSRTEEELRQTTESRVRQADGGLVQGGSEARVRQADEELVQGGSEARGRQADADSLRVSVLEKIHKRTQRRMTSTSMRISEIQRLLSRHTREFSLRSSDVSLRSQGSKAMAAGEYQEHFPLDNISKTEEELWSSPYLNDTTLDMINRYYSRGGAYSRYCRKGVLYLPVGLIPEQDADGNTVGGSGSFIVLDGSTVSAAPFPGTLEAMRRAEEDSVEGAKPLTKGCYLSPFAAVMDYCQGVQMGRPLGRRAGPVYVFQAECGGYYVGDETGRNILKDADEAAGDAPSNARSGPGVGRSLLPMTRILFPAPAGLSSDTTEAASSVGVPFMKVSVEPPAGLNPIYFVPMAIPMEDDDAVAREGWQACHRHGHTRHDPIYYPTLDPLPLSISPNHVVPQPGNPEDVARAKAMTSITPVGYFGPSSTSRNRYFHSPPRVFRPADESAKMIRIRSVQLQKSQTGSDDIADAAAVAHNGVACAGSGSSSPSKVAHLAMATSATFPSAAGHCSGCSTVDESPPLATSSVLTTGSPDIQGNVSTAPLLGDPQSLSTLPLMPSLSTAPGAGLTTMANDSASDPAKPVLLTSPGSTSVFSSARSTGPFAAALVVAKEQRNRRLAEEAARTSEETTSHPYSFRNQVLSSTVPSTEGDAQRVPARHLAPLPSLHSSGHAPTVLPPPAESARLQRKLPAGKHLRTVAIPPSRLREIKRGGGSANLWNLKSEGFDAE